MNDPIDTWPLETISLILEKGLVTDWQPVLDDLHARPWGRVARLTDRYCRVAEDEAEVVMYFETELMKARANWLAREKETVALRVKAAIGLSGLSARAFGEAVGITSSVISKYVSATRTPSATMLIRIERQAIIESDRAHTPVPPVVVPMVQAIRETEELLDEAAFDRVDRESLVSWEKVKKDLGLP